MNAITVAVAGIEQLTRALKLTNVNTRAAMKREVARGTKAVVAGAKERVHRGTGELADTIRDEYSPDGMTGYAKVGFGTLPRRSKSASGKRIARLRAKKRRTGKGAYGPVVERGDPRRHHLPHPFLMPAFSQEKPAIISGMNRALDQAIPSELR